MILILQAYGFSLQLGKQHDLRHLNLLDVKLCTEVPSNIQHAKIKARVHVR